MTKMEKIIINQKRQEWRATKEAEFDTLFVGVKLDEDEEVTEVFNDAFGTWLGELEQYQVTTQDEDGVDVVNTYSRKVRTMPRFSVSDADIDAYNRKYNVPKVVTMRQARLALLQYGILSTVENAIMGSVDEAMKIEWEYATEVRRDWTSLIELCGFLNINETTLDDLFMLAKDL